MELISTTKMSSKGQVVIPEAVRKKLGLVTGDQFIVVGEGDVLILKVISKPSIKEFDSVIKKARRQAKAAGLKRSNIKEAIRKVRTAS